jgi:hypothetical protein
MPNLCLVLSLYMKNITACIFLYLLLTGCKKTIENAQEDIIIKAMTDGQWVITSFTHNGVNITSDFSAYKFQYYSNKTVDAINNGTVEKTGTWDGNASTLSIAANFTNANYPLSLINGSWHIDNNSWTFVEASQNAGTETKTLRLEKQ